MMQIGIIVVELSYFPNQFLYVNPACIRHGTTAMLIEQYVWRFVLEIASVDLVSHDNHVDDFARGIPEHGKSGQRGM